MPGETEETIQETIQHAKNLPLDLALFHIAAPYPGTPFFFEVVQNNWFRPGPIMTYLKMLTSDLSTFKSALNVGLQHLGWATSGS